MPGLREASAASAQVPGTPAQPTGTKQGSNGQTGCEARGQGELAVREGSGTRQDTETGAGQCLWPSTQVGPVNAVRCKNELRIGKTRHHDWKAVPTAGATRNKYTGRPCLTEAGQVGHARAMCSHDQTAPLCTQAPEHTRNRLSAGAAFTMSHHVLSQGEAACLPACPVPARGSHLGNSAACQPTGREREESRHRRQRAGVVDSSACGL